MQSTNLTDSIGVTVVGAGLAGSLLALYLARRGFKVELFERSTDPRQAPVNGEGRSINLALANRGIAALEGVGLHHRVGALTVPMTGRMVHIGHTEPTLMPYGQSAAEVIYSVHRGELNNALLDAAEASRRVRCHFNQELLAIDFGQPAPVLTFKDHQSGRQYQHHNGPVFGADGVGSAVRQAIMTQTGGTHRSDMLEHGYREFGIAPTASGQPALDPNALHIWPRGNLMLIALPNRDASFTATLFMAREGEVSFAELDSEAEMPLFLARQFPDVADLLQLPDPGRHPVGVLGSLYCEPWFSGGQAVIVGDAAHAIVPFHGQGMNCAFEDVAELDRCINDAKTWEQAFTRFQHRRLTNTRAIAEMALENYHEMRSAVADPGYRLRRALEQELERRFPRRFVPRYSMVMFRQLDYAQAQARGKVNLEILMALTRTADRLEDVDWVRAEGLIEQRLTPLG